MTMDFTRLIDRLDPPADGETPVRHRTGIVDAVNSDGTVDLILSGIVVPSVSVLAGASVSVGATVQVVAWSGDLLVLGQSALSPVGSAAGEVRILNGLSTVTFTIPAGAARIDFGWTGRTDQGISTTTQVRLEFDGDTGANYDRALAVFNSSGLSGASLFATGAALGIVVGVAGGDSTNRESAFDGTVIRGTRAVVTGTGVAAIAGDAANQLAIHGGGRYRVASPALTQFRIFLAGGAQFASGRAYVRAF